MVFKKIALAVDRWSKYIISFLVTITTMKYHSKFRQLSINVVI